MTPSGVWVAAVVLCPRRGGTRRDGGLKRWKRLVGEAHKGRERGGCGRWAAAGRDHEIGDLEIWKGGVGGSGGGRTKVVPV